MAVYTTLEHDEIAELVKPFGIGELLHYEGINQGLENTNYFITTSSTHLGDEVSEDTKGQYVLTVFEELPESHLPFHIKLLELLDNRDLPVAFALKDYNGEAVQHIKGKPAILVLRLYGEHIDQAGEIHCQQIGKVLADIHLAAADIAESYEGIRNAEWLKQCVSDASAFLQGDESSMVQGVLDEYLEVVRQDELPRGIIHGDLFRDNALFKNDELVGVIDFYNAGEGYLLFDLGVVVNDWCVDTHGNIDLERYNALVNAYTESRPFTDIEKQYWPLFLKICALRFWMSRLLRHNQKQEISHQELMDTKHPEEFQKIFLKHMESVAVELP